METAGLLLRVVVALVSVLGLVWLFSRGMTRGRGRRLVPGMTEVLSRQVLSRAASVVVVRVGDKALVLGVTEQQVNVLGETDLPAEDDAAAPRRTEKIDLPDDLTPPPATAPADDVADALVPRQRRRRAAAAAAQGPRTDGALAGSALSPATWTQALDVLRERTTRR